MRLKQFFLVFVLFALLHITSEFEFPLFKQPIKSNFKPTLESVNKHRNILAFVFPGGKSHHFIFKTLFDYVNKRLKEDKSEISYNFTLIVHNIDKKLWDNLNYTTIGYGNIENYEEKFHNAMEHAKSDPVLGYNSFNLAMMHMYDDFLADSKILNILKQTKWDMILSDITNSLSVFLRQQLNISKSIYLNPTCVFTWLLNTFEYNAAHVPLIGSQSDHNMKFWERFINQFFLTATRGMYKWFTKVQNTVFQNYGYTEYIMPFEQHALYMNQCVDGVHSPYSKPPSHISTGAILPRPALPLEKDSELDLFLNKNKKNIYVSQGTITKVLRVDQLLDVFAAFPEYGFILSLKKHFHISDLELLKNVYLTEWVPQNDLLGDDRIVAFITHGGINSLLESIYHAKPMVVIGTSIDQVNGAVMVNTRKIGVGITREYQITVKNLIESIQTILSDDDYVKNVIYASGLIKDKDGKETFYYWLNFVMDFGYEQLLVPAYSQYNFIEINNIDIWILFSIIFALFLQISFKVIRYSLFKVKNTIFK